jgi:Uma2 family endonuclease
MPEVIESPPAVPTLADLLQQLGNIPPERVRMRPAPGKATVRDVIEIERKENRLFELMDGVLVEKTMGYEESSWTMFLIHVLQAHVLPRNLGIVAGPDGMIKLARGLVRIPDVSFISWDRFPGRRRPKAPVLALAPDLAVEVLSPSNTPEEMARKLREYFAAGVRLVWLVDQRARTVTVYTSPDHSEVLRGSDTLTGDPVLPGFAISLKSLFAELDRHGNA